MKKELMDRSNSEVAVIGSLKGTHLLMPRISSKEEKPLKCLAEFSNREWMEHIVEIDVDQIRRLDMALVCAYRINVEKHLAYRGSGFKYEVFSNEHPPPHFRVLKGSDSAVFDLRTGDFIHGSGKIRKLRQCVSRTYPEIRSILIRRWNETRPSDCSVGPLEDD